MHVDNFIFAGTEYLKKNVIDPVISKYKVGKRQNDHFREVDLDVRG